MGFRADRRGDNRSIMRVLAKLYILVHLRALEKISELTLSQSTNQKSDRFVNVCDSVDLDSLVENVTHMLLYVLHLRYAKGGRETPIANQINAQYKSNAALTAHIEANGTPPTQGRVRCVNPPMLPMFAPRRRAWASRPWLLISSPSSWAGASSTPWRPTRSCRSRR